MEKIKDDILIIFKELASIEHGYSKIDISAINDRFKDLQLQETYNLSRDIILDSVWNKVNKLTLQDFRIPKSMQGKPIEKMTQKQVELIRNRINEISTEISKGAKNEDK